MQRFQYCSDLHLEFRENEEYIRANPIQATANVLLLAGDILPFVNLDRFAWFFDALSEQFETVYWIPGNHEYYHSDIRQRSGAFREAIRKNVFLLNNQVETINGIRLIFSTLWSQISPGKELEIAQNMNDFHVIRKGQNRFLPADFNLLHSASKQFLQDALQNNENKQPSVVITHHVPTFFQYPEEYKGSLLSEAFAVELHDFIATYQPDYWVFGHHHGDTPNFEIGSTQLVHNQLGYVEYREHLRYSTKASFQL